MAQQGILLDIDPSRMMQTAQTFDVQRIIIENCMNKIRDDAKALESVWEGESANAYKTAMDKLEENSPKIVSIITEYVKNLNDIASRFISDELVQRTKNEALPGDIFGV